MLEELQQEMAELKAKMVERGQEIFKEETKRIFAENPNLESFSWTQYTPYFNDGDTCYFGVNDYLEVRMKDGEIHEDVNAWSLERHEAEPQNRQDYWESDEDRPMLMELADLVSGVPSDVMQDMFGDHARVIVRETGIEIEEYEHE